MNLDIDTNRNKAIILNREEISFIVYALVLSKSSVDESEHKRIDDILDNLQRSRYIN